MNDPSLPQILITIDPETGNYDATFDEIKESILIPVLQDLLEKAEARTLPTQKEPPSDV